MSGHPYLCGPCEACNKAAKEGGIILLLVVMAVTVVALSVALYCSSRDSRDTPIKAELEDLDRGDYIKRLQRLGNELTKLIDADIDNMRLIKGCDTHKLNRIFDKNPWETLENVERCILEEKERQNVK